jgi:hypothetical protein
MLEDECDRVETEVIVPVFPFAFDFGDIYEPYCIEKDSHGIIAAKREKRMKN